MAVGRNTGRGAAARDRARAAGGRMPALAAALSVLMAATLGAAGCKFSDTITELVPDRTVETKVDAPALTVSGENAREDERGAVQKAKGDDVGSREQVAVAYDPDARNKRYRSAEVVYDPERATTKTQASKGGAESSDGKRDNRDSARRTDGADGNGGSGGAGRGNGDGDGEGNDGNGDGGSIARSQENAPQEETPSGKRVAAAGEAANIVQMLTGECRKAQLAHAAKASEANYLVATDAKFQKAVAKKGAYPGEGVDKAALAWKKTDGASDGGLDVKALKKAAVDLVVYESDTATVDADDVKALKKAGIKMLAMSSLAQDSGIVEAVAQVAEALSKGAGGDKGAIVDKAASWNKLHDNLIDAIVGNNGGWSTSGGYSFDKDERPENATAEHKRTVTLCRFVQGTPKSELSSAGITCACIGLAKKKWTDFPFYHYLSAAGVLDLPMGAAGSIANHARKEAGASVSVSKSLSTAAFSGYQVIAPFGGPIHGFSRYAGFPESVDGSLVLDNGNYTAGGSISTSLGSSSYPALIVRTDKMRSELSSACADTKSMWFYDESRHERFDNNFNLSGPFDILAMPEGLLGSWMDGSPESFLAVAWARSHFYDDYSASKVKTRVEKFYKEFYRAGSPKLNL